MGQLFVAMALMYPWATKEYLLWKCSLGQIIMYHNKGAELKFGPVKKPDSLMDMSHAELKEYRQKLKDEGLIEKKKASDDAKAALGEKYGEI